ncbi:protein cortex-like [Macrosteles quadrilineatus]|uniref:protein cortex-like n=1 Tax=Macrosteles quadrilineatus TaxID=74068 RepID=UPI0023E119F5|nr:protein cortex-like [Macrosteles quadrilineatus]
MSPIEFSQGLQHEVKVWDRFIRNRETVQHRFIDSPKSDEKVCDDAIIHQEPYWKSKELYKQLLASSLSLHCRPDSWSAQWPVKSRCKPHLLSPNIVLDLPNMRQNVYGCNIVDWSVTGYLTVSFPRSVYLWQASNNQTLKIDYKDTCCVKWNVDGTGLFMASRCGAFKYSDMNINEELTTKRSAPCHLSCFISCCAFHPRSPIMYMGCCLGSVTAHYVNKGLHMFLQIVAMHKEESIVSLGASPDGTYLAVTHMSNEIAIYETTKYNCLFNIVMMGPSRGVAWHPWKKHLLVVADCLGYMALYNVLDPLNPLATYESAYDCSILNITFNPISAELVVSQNVYNDGTGSPYSQLSVLASFDRVVDRMDGHEGPVQFLNWSPDGTQLATSGSDETARIWDFLPQNFKQRTKKSSKINSISASLEIGKRMGLSIR